MVFGYAENERKRLISLVKGRKRIVEAWHKFGCPPRAGKNEDEIVESFNQLASHIFDPPAGYGLGSRMTYRDELMPDVKTPDGEGRHFQPRRWCWRLDQGRRRDII